MRRFTALIFSFLVLFIAQNTMGKDLFKGEVLSLIESENSLWIKTNQAHVLQDGSVIYIHDADDNLKAILKVSQIQPRFIKGNLIDGELADIKIGDPVKNMFQWDSFQCLVTINYEKSARKIAFQDYVMIDRQLTVYKGKDRQTIDGREVKTIKMSYSGGSLKAKEIVLKDGRSMLVNDADISGLRKLEERKAEFDVPGVGKLELTAADIRSVTVEKKIKGAVKVVNLHYSLGESALPIDEGGRYSVTFKFLNYELGREALEDQIAASSDENEINNLVQNLKLYNKNNIKKVTVAGTFNGWDKNRDELKRTNQDIFEKKVPLSKGTHYYFFVVTFEGTETMDLEVLDPYSNTYTEGDHGEVSYVEVPGPDFANKVLTQKDLPYNLDELAVEESKVKSDEDAILDDLKYRKVTFKFNLLPRVRTDLKRTINSEASKSAPDKKLMKHYQAILKDFSESKVQKVVVSGSFNDWNSEQYPLTKGDDGVWTCDVYIPEGEYQYNYLIETGLGSKKNLHVIDREDRYISTLEDGTEVSTLYVGVEPPAEAAPEPEEESPAPDMAEPDSPATSSTMTDEPAEPTDSTPPDTGDGNGGASSIDELIK